MRIPDFFAAATGLSAKVLQQSPEHERNETATRGLQLVGGGVFHVLSMAATLTIFGIPFLPALGFSLLTALLLFTADRSLISGLREQRGSAALDDKGLSIGAVLGPAARVASAIIIGVLMGAGLGLALFDRDTQAYVAERQASSDQPLIAKLNAEYDQTLAQKAESIQASKVALDAAAAEAQAREQALTGGISAVEARGDALLGRRQALWDASAKTQSELEAWTDKARCERDGISDLLVCEGTSGTKGEGTLWQFATDKANSLASLLGNQKRELETVEAQIAALPPASANVALIDVDRHLTLQTSYDRQTAEYRNLLETRPEAIAAMLAASPERKVIDPMSIYIRIDAIGHLMSSSLSFFITALAAKTASVILELLPLLCELGRRATVYDLNVAAAVQAAYRAHRKRILEDEAEDLPLFADIDRRRREIEREAFVASFMRRNHDKTTQ